MTISVMLPRTTYLGRRHSFMRLARRTRDNSVLTVINEAALRVRRG